MYIQWKLITLLVVAFSVTFMVTYHLVINVAKQHAIETVLAVQADLQTLKEENERFSLKYQTESRNWRKAKNDRETLSKRLNQAVHEFNLLRCSITNDTTDTGAWCEWPLANKHFTDENLAVAMAILFENKSIASFGDGPGNYKSLLLSTGLVRSYDSFDGSPYIENATNGNVKYLDLTIPHFGLPLYDWVLSIEVAEHIPQEYEQIYFSNLIRHAGEGIVMSWAVPFQLGVGHVNPRPKEYVIQLFTSNCFDFDSVKTNILKRKTTIPWVQKNLLVFSRRSTCAIDIDET